MQDISNPSEPVASSDGVRQTASPRDFPVAPRRSRRIIPAVILSIAIFFFGLITGAGLTAVYIRAKISETIKNPEVGLNRAQRVLTRRLKLDDDQQRCVYDILKKRQQHLQAIRKEVLPRVKKELDAGKAEIDAVLRPGQLGKWNAIVQKLRERFQPPD